MNFGETRLTSDCTRRLCSIESFTHRVSQKVLAESASDALHVRSFSSFQVVIPDSRDYIMTNRPWFHPATKKRGNKGHSPTILFFPMEPCCETAESNVSSLLNLAIEHVMKWHDSCNWMHGEDQLHIAKSRQLGIAKSLFGCEFGPMDR